MIVVQPPHLSNALIGHDEAQNQLLNAYDSGRMHHAWIFTGPQGVGKTTLAFHLAHMVLSGGANRLGQIDPTHPTARLIFAESHPDLLVVRRPVDEKTGALRALIPVDDARKITPFLSLTSSHASGRMVIIDEAHTLNRNGQNAILKMLEEPPAGATIVLTATSMGMMLPTIRSRCRTLSLGALSESQISTILARQSIELPPEMSPSQLYDLAAGSAGRAISLLQADIIPLFDELMLILTALPQLDLVRIHALGEQIGRKTDADRFQALSQTMVDVLQKAILAAASGRPDPTGLAAKLAPQGRLDKALQLWDSVTRSLAMAQQASLDRKLTFINAVSEMSRLMASD